MYRELVRWNMVTPVVYFEMEHLLVEYLDVDYLKNLEINIRYNVQLTTTILIYIYATVVKYSTPVP